jgi:hypothetical protein
MMDTTTREWKDVSPDDVTSGSAWDTGLEMVCAAVVKVSGSMTT